MSHDGNPEQPLPSSEPETVMQPRQPHRSAVQATSATSQGSSRAPAGFDEVEGPTLSSPSLSSDPKLGTIAALEQRIAELESRLNSTEQELQEVYGAVEHLVTGQEKTDLAVRQQRLSRYLVWGTLIVILGIFWMTLQSRFGGMLPR
jgi:uncharacterized coiled-coil protein SlyX